MNNISRQYVYGLEATAKALQAERDAARDELSGQKRLVQNLQDCYAAKMEECKALRETLESMKQSIEFALSDLRKGGMRLQPDSSWIRPRPLLEKEATEYIRQAVLRLQAALAAHGGGAEEGKG